MSLKIIKSGILDTVQDLGRTGYRALGVNPGGAADSDAVRILNTLLGNPESCAVLETHFPPLSIEFLEDTVFAVGGAHFLPEIEAGEVPLWTSVRAEPGNVLRFTGRKHGTRAYLAVEGGIDAERWLGSASTNLFAGAGGMILREGDRVETGEKDAVARAGMAAGRSMTDRFLREPVLRVTAGPEHHLLTAVASNAFETSEFRVRADSNRMGIRLEGHLLGAIDEIDLVSSAVAPGIVQLLPEGSVVILGADAQTTGGYPRIARVISADLSLAAQAAPGDTVRFRTVSLEEAYKARCAFERDLSFLRLGLRFRSP